MVSVKYDHRCRCSKWSPWILYHPESTIWASCLNFPLLRRRVSPRFGFDFNVALHCVLISSSVPVRPHSLPGKVDMRRTSFLRSPPSPSQDSIREFVLFEWSRVLTPPFQANSQEVRPMHRLRMYGFWDSLKSPRESSTR